jgi:hypothetical protein
MIIWVTSPDRGAQASRATAGVSAVQGRANMDRDVTLGSAMEL